MLSKAVKDVIFVSVVMKLKILVKLLIMVRVDNVEAIFMAGNVIAISHSKHMDIRNKYVN